VGKWVALAWAVASVVRRFPFLKVRLNADGHIAAASTPFVFIGNNEYEVEGLSLGSRSRLDSGKLWLYMAPHRPTRLGAACLLLRALMGRVRQDKDFFATTATEVRVETPLSMLAVALDGEVVLMRTPLDYRTRPGRLRVIVPAEAA
jgi:diacylglycerol kinase family enzyme